MLFLFSVFLAILVCLFSHLNFIKKQLLNYHKRAPCNPGDFIKFIHYLKENSHLTLSTPSDIDVIPFTSSFLTLCAVVYFSIRVMSPAFQCCCFCFKHQLSLSGNWEEKKKGLLYLCTYWPHPVLLSDFCRSQFPPGTLWRPWDVLRKGTGQLFIRSNLTSLCVLEVVGEDISCLVSDFMGRAFKMLRLMVFWSFCYDSVGWLYISCKTENDLAICMWETCCFRSHPRLIAFVAYILLVTPL